ncbi:MAG: hypothetical protein JXB47_11895 [Anaerolineae bacterium]|nr:hypothetical protein [Anaerolineae bacterium]
MTNFHVLVSDPLHRAGLAMFEAAEGITFTAPGKMSRVETLAAIPQAHALVIRSGTKADSELIARAEKLKIIGRAGVGVDNIDLEAATGRGIVVMNAPDANTIAVAELTLGLMLALARQIPDAHASLAAGEWKRSAFSGAELRGKKLGIIGMGRIGKAVAERAAAFDMRIICVDPIYKLHRIVDGYTENVTRDELWAESDYITLHAPSKEDTRCLINAETIARMKDGVRIINTARGAIVDAHALADAIKRGKVAGAALDVYDPEPPGLDNPLIGLPGVVHVPHIGANTAEAQAEVAVQTVAQVLDGLLKGQFRNVVNSGALALDR